MGDSTLSDEKPDDPFRSYHRGGLRAAVLRGAALLGLAALVAAPLGWAVASGDGQNPALSTELAIAEAQRVVVHDERLAAQSEWTAERRPDAGPVPPAEPATVIVRQPAPEPPPETEPAAPAAPRGPRPDLTITVDTVGYQEQIDQCLWVRMDFGASPAPIVAAHNYCGGDVVLDLRKGDLVQLRGVDLDGLYLVTAAREVRTGEKVKTATDGIVADAILQTCFWHTGTTRLVSVERVD